MRCPRGAMRSGVPTPGGLCTTAFPEARAGAIRHVASIRGAFHGPITAVTPDGSHVNRSRFPLNVASAAPSKSKSLSAKYRKFRATRGITEDRCERRRDPLSRVSTAESSSIRVSTPSAIRCRTAARSFGGVRPHSSAARPATSTATPTVVASPRATSAMTCSSMGETSGNRSGELRRSPPTRWSVEIATLSTTASSSVVSSESFVSERYGSALGRVNRSARGRAAARRRLSTRARAG